MNEIGAVVVRYRGGEEVASCLAALTEHGGSRLTRVVLVDSGSGDGGGERLGERFPEVELVALSENRSFAWAVGIGAERLRTPYLLILNPDTEVGPGSIDRLADFLDAHPQAAGAVPLLIGADGSSQHRWQLRRLPGPGRLALGLPGRPAFAVPPTVATPVAQPAAACWLLRREVWTALDGLDPAFAPAWWEDVDFCARLARISHRLSSRDRGDTGQCGVSTEVPPRRAVGTSQAVPPQETSQRPGSPRSQQEVGETFGPSAARPSGLWVVPGATVRHLGGSSVAVLGDTAFFTAYFSNLRRYARRHHPGAARGITAALRLGLLLRALCRPGRRRAYLAARRRLADKLEP